MAVTLPILFSVSYYSRVLVINIYSRDAKKVIDVSYFHAAFDDDR